MNENGNIHPTIVRTGRGLTISGTRTTIYEVMDYLKAEWPPALVQQWLILTEEQMTAALQYIEAHQEELEIEYQIVLHEAEASRAYWEEKNRGRFEQIATLPPPPGQEALAEKIKASKTALRMK